MVQKTVAVKTRDAAKRVKWMTERGWILVSTSTRWGLGVLPSASAITVLCFRKSGS